MAFETKQLFEALGPNATVIFAAWIFLTFLQQRYSAAYTRYRDLVAGYRGGEARDRERLHRQPELREATHTRPLKPRAASS